MFSLLWSVFEIAESTDLGWMVVDRVLFVSEEEANNECETLYEQGRDPFIQPVWQHFCFSYLYDEETQIGLSMYYTKDWWALADWLADQGKDEWALCCRATKR